MPEPPPHATRLTGQRPRRARGNVQPSGGRPPFWRAVFPGRACGGCRRHAGACRAAAAAAGRPPARHDRRSLQLAGLVPPTGSRAQAQAAAGPSGHRSLPPTGSRARHRRRRPDTAVRTDTAACRRQLSQSDRPPPAGTRLFAAVQKPIFIIGSNCLSRQVQAHTRLPAARPAQPSHQQKQASIAAISAASCMGKGPVSTGRRGVRQWPPP